MKNLKRLGISVTLLCLLAVPVFADGTDSCAPGSTNSPPCASRQVISDAPVPSGETISLPAPNSEAEYWSAHAAVDLLMNALLLF